MHLRRNHDVGGPKTRPLVKRAVRFFAAAAGLIAVIAVVLSLVFPGAENLRAIIISAVLALVVQLASFLILQAMRGQGVMVGWGIGSLVRFGTLIVYGFLATRTLGLPLSAALFSLAAFLFATSILEPVMLER
ncbi:MAG: hypothetical protein ABIV11_07610 [Gemmatimonadaceae bacterium]